MGTEESAPNTREAETGVQCTCTSHPGTWCHACGTDRPVLRIADDVAEVMRRYKLSGPDGARAAEYILGLERQFQERVREAEALGMRLANQRKELRQLNRRQQSLFPAHVHNGTRPASVDAAATCCAYWREQAEHFEKKFTSDRELARVDALSKGEADSQSTLIGTQSKLISTHISNQERTRTAREADRRMEGPSRDRRGERRARASWHGGRSVGIRGDARCGTRADRERAGAPAE
jgi:hypothetical protein